MATFYIKARKLGPIEVSTVDAPTRDAAIAQFVAAGGPGEEFEVMDAQPNPIEVVAPTGPSGTTGTALLR